jgi:hypothetical protein
MMALFDGPERQRRLRALRTSIRQQLRAEAIATADFSLLFGSPLPRLCSVAYSSTETFNANFSGHEDPISPALNADNYSVFLGQSRYWHRKG